MAWAGKMKPGSPSEKLVLIGYAQCADANHCAYPSIDWLCDFGPMNRKTVILAIQRLEAAGLMSDTGERKGRTKQVKVYRLAAGKDRDPALNSPETGTVPKTERFQKRNSSGFTRKQSLNRDTEPVREHTPIIANAIMPPQGGPNVRVKQIRASRIADDWQPPAMSDLPPEAKAKVRQWPKGAYQAEAAAFRQYWRGEGGRKARKVDWLCAWLHRVNDIDTARLLRDAKAGVRFDPDPVERGEAVELPKLDTSRETVPARSIRELLGRRLGKAAMAQWFGGSRLDVVEGTLTVVAPSAFASTYQRNNFADEVGRAMHKILGIDADLRWSVEQVK